jgi:hypothetical protein
MAADDNRPSKRSIAELYAWWQHRRAGRAMPRRSELDPAALRHALPDLLIIDVGAGTRPGTHVFTYRLTGTRVDSRLGINLKGRTVETAELGDATAAVQQQYETAVAERRALLSSHSLVVGERRHVEYHRLVVPLASEDEAEVASLVAAVDFMCAYAIGEGKPRFCPDPYACGQKDLYVPMIGEPVRLPIVRNGP